ncbi:metallophosphoesterase family protein [Priestia megaterium]|uniref:metallophosphoesterase family protein n=1 Tax=Priestia megaterium TaxID=1404 RepID=UPI00186739BE|nr:metallophosphoesterase family protein [Priestia megaterium]MBE2978662.1 metallophosphoesterase family protein [Priestia megaterium]
MYNKTYKGRRLCLLKQRIAIISDIHGNSLALEAVLSDISHRGINAIFNLGDSLYGPLDPLGTFKLLMEHNITHIMGNCDRMIVDSSDNDSSSTINYVKRSLTIEALDWLQQHSRSLIIDDIFLCHGTPHSDEVYLLEEMTEEGATLKSSKDIINALEGVEQDVVLCGHSHIPRTLYLPNGKLIINPGSVGLPAYIDGLPIPHKMESGSPHANYTIIEKRSTNWLVDQISVPYHWEKAAAMAEINQRQDWADALRMGRF